VRHVVTLSNVSVAFGQTLAVDRVTAAFVPGDIVLLAGASGCGKSTLLRAVTGIIPHAVPASLIGEVVIDGQRTVDLPLEVIAQKAGLVFQSPAAQVFHLTVDDEIAFGPSNLGLSRSDVAARTAWAIGAMGLAGVAGREIQSLSGGERQRVAVAAVLAMRPALLALDEPMASLDVSGTRLLVDTLQDLQRADGTTILIAEHRLREAALVAGRTMLMDGGRVVADGPTRTVLGEKALLRQLGLRRPALVPQADWEALIVAGAGTGGAPMVELQGINASYGAEAVLHDIDLTIREGDCVALVGDNGSGKSTIARLLAGMIRPTSGRCRWSNGASAPGTGVGVVLQEPREQLFCETVEEELAFGPRNFGLDADGLTGRMLTASDLVPVRSRPLHTLSHGQLHRTAVAAVLALRPRLLILDEPTVGQDWGHLERLMDELEGLRQSGSAVLLISHDFKLIHRHATRVVLLRNGRVAAEGIPVEASAEEEAL
jgi:energy-coupling factor transport system ATP-binding protein